MNVNYSTFRFNFKIIYFNCAALVCHYSLQNILRSNFNYLEKILHASDHIFKLKVISIFKECFYYITYNSILLK